MQKIFLLPGSETIVLARCADRGCFFLQLEERLFINYRARFENGVGNVLSSRPLRIVVTNLACHEKTLCTAQVLGHAVPSRPQNLCAIAPDQKPEDLEPVDAVLSWAHVDQEPQATQAEENTIDSIDLSEILRKVQRPAKGMLTKPKEIWSGMLGEIQAPSHRIKLISGAIRVHSQLHMAGPKVM